MTISGSNPRTISELTYRSKCIRLFELEISNRYGDGLMRCPTHLSVGQELAGAAVGCVKRIGDQAVSGHRSHAHYLGFGGDPRALAAELFGLEEGASSGWGGSMHLIDRSVGFEGSTAIVAGSIPVGIGIAYHNLLSLKASEFSPVCWVFLGDAALEEGVSFESLLIAATKNVPVVFVCEDNGFSVYTDLATRRPNGFQLEKYIAGLGIKYLEASDDSAALVLDALKEAREFSSTGNGPVFVKINTSRYLEHCGPNLDNNVNYREPLDLDFLLENDWLSDLSDSLTTSEAIQLNRRIAEFQQLLQIWFDEFSMLAKGRVQQ